MSYSPYNRNSYSPGGFSMFPPVIKNLLMFNGIVFLIQFVMKSSQLVFNDTPMYEIITRWFALMPLSSGDFKIWQLITYQFMHADISHIFFNMFALWMFGMEIENLWGSKKFLYYYLTCGAGAGVLQLLFASQPAATIGASGAIYGILVAFAMFFPDREIYLYFVLPVKAKYLIIGYVLFEFLSIGSISYVAHLVHFGGAIIGVIFILIDKNFDVKQMFRSKPKNVNMNNFKSRVSSYQKKPNVQEASFYEINDEEKKDNIKPDQESIDMILDKISQSGYQNLTEEEKRILFEASKNVK